MYKQNFTRNSTFLLATAVAGVISAPTALAQLEEVVVTAQKREQNSNDIGMAISALTGDTMQKMGVLDTTDLAVAIPGLTFADSGLSTPIYTLRGVGFNEESVQAQATVGVYNDQIAVPFPIMTKGLLMDVERVEVLKGPQGTLFGRNSTGGAINYIANKPTDEFEASITGGYGRFETSDIAGTVSGPLTDNIRGRVTAKTLQSGEGWQKSVSRDDELGEMDKSAARGLLDIDVTDTFNVLLGASWWQDKSDTLAPQFLSPAYQGLFGNPNTVVEGLLDSGDDARISSLDDDDNRDADWTGGNNRLGNPELDMKSHNFSATINWDINDSVQLTSLSSYSKFDSDSRYNADGYGGMPGDKAVGGISAIDTIAAIVRDQYSVTDTFSHSTFINDSDIESWSQELRFSGDFDSLSWIVGGYYSHDEVDSTTSQVVDVTTNTNIAFFPIPGEIGLQTLNNLSDQEGDTWAIFGHTEWGFADDWKLTLGLRYTEDEKDFEGCTQDTGDGDTSQYVNTLVFVNTGGAVTPDTVAGGCATFLPGTFTGGIIKKELDEDSTSGKLALDWNITDDVLTYVSYSRGYKSGSFPTLSTNVDTQLDPVVQEKVDAYELGMKASLLDGAAQFNTAVFYYDYTDKQLLSKTPTIFGALGSLGNVPEAEVTGAEFDLQWAPLDGLLVGLAATYTDTNIKKFVGFNQYGVQGDMSDSDFPLTPELQATAMVNYEWGVGNNMMAYIGADASYSDDFTSDYDIKSVVNDGTNGNSYNALLDGLGLEAGDTYGVQEPFKLDDSLLIGARFGLRSADSTWNAMLWGRNITDEFQPVNSKKTTDGVVRYTGMPATYGVTISYNWF
jgi:outer membrane receptor protein involved in Fe transport